MAHRQYISFYVDEFLYGIDIRIVKEVNSRVNIAHVPRSKPVYRGLVNIRGQVVLVIDVAVVFGRQQRPVGEESKILILKTAPELSRLSSLNNGLNVEKFGSKPVGILIDRIGDMVTAEPSEVKAPPPHLVEGHASCVEGVVRLEEEMMIVLNAAEIL